MQETYSRGGHSAGRTSLQYLLYGRKRKTDRKTSCYSKKMGKNTFLSFLESNSSRTDGRGWGYGTSGWMADLDGVTFYVRRSTPTPLYTLPYPIPYHTTQFAHSKFFHSQEFPLFVTLKWLLDIYKDFLLLW